jgi:hypothetical protein
MCNIKISWKLNFIVLFYWILFSIC